MRKFNFQWPINHASVSHNGKLICVAGDTEIVKLVESDGGKHVGSLVGHKDFSFATAWRPHDGNQVVTGAQDKTTRIWDIRMFKSLKVLPGCIGAIRSLEYSHDGTMLAASECADFVHLYDAQMNYSREQQLDVFGEISGICFSPQDECFFVGMYDRVYSKCPLPLQF